MTYHNVRGPDGKFVKKSSTTSFLDNRKVSEKQPRDKFGRFLPKTQKAKTQKVSKPKTKEVVPPSVSVNNNVASQVTHIAILLDESGSMGVIKSFAVDAVNKQIGDLKVQAQITKEKTKITLATFSCPRVYYPYSATAIKDFYAKEVFPESVRQLTVQGYRPGGGTALNDAILEVLNLWKQDLASFNDENHSYLLMIVTDGEENQSRNATFTVESELKKCFATDRFTVAFSGPVGCMHYTRSIGLDDSNVQVWEQSSAGVQQMAANNTFSTQQYMTKRSIGAKKVEKFYANINKIDTNKLTNATSFFKSWQVPKETDITSFVMEKVHTYNPGHGFYEVTKKEKVQASKNLYIQNKFTGQIYGGHSLKKEMGLPLREDMYLEPGNYGEYKLFVQSTSANRILVRGTTLLYLKS